MPTFALTRGGGIGSRVLCKIQIWEHDMSRKIEIGLLAISIVVGVSQLAQAEPCPTGQSMPFVTRCLCTNAPATAYYCQTCQAGSDCPPCSLSIAGIYCGSSGKSTCYVSNTTYACIDPPRSRNQRDLALSDGPSFVGPQTSRSTTGGGSNVRAGGSQHPPK